MQFVKSHLEPIMIILNGVEYPARLNFKALAELEELIHDSFMVLFDRFSEGKFTINDILSLVYVSLKCGGVEIEIDDLQDMDFSPEFFKESMKEITKLLSRTQKVVSSIEASHKEKGTSKKK